MREVTKRLLYEARVLGLKLHLINKYLLVLKIKSSVILFMNFTDNFLEISLVTRPGSTGEAEQQDVDPLYHLLIAII